jgi:hypothetical protein
MALFFRYLRSNANKSIVLAFAKRNVLPKWKNSYQMKSVKKGISTQPNLTSLKNDQLKPIYTTKLMIFKFSIKYLWLVSII